MDKQKFKLTGNLGKDIVNSVMAFRHNVEFLSDDERMVGFPILFELWFLFAGHDITDICFIGADEEFELVGILNICYKLPTRNDFCIFFALLLRTLDSQLQRIFLIVHSLRYYI